MMNSPCADLVDRIKDLEAEVRRLNRRIEYLHPTSDRFIPMNPTVTR